MHRFERVLAAANGTSTIGLEMPSGTTFAQSVGRQLQQQDAARVLVDEQDLIGQRRETLAHARIARSSRCAIERWRSAAPCRAPRRHALRATKPREKASVLARRVRQLVTPQRGEYMPTLPSTPKAVSNPSPVSPSASSATTCS
jgi:hypothetical protein